MPDGIGRPGFLRTLVRDSVRALVWGLVIIVLLVGATKALGDQQALGVRYQKAIACELAIPSSPTTGRNPVLVAECFSIQGLPAPEFVRP